MKRTRTILTGVSALCGVLALAACGNLLLPKAGDPENTETPPTLAQKVRGIWMVGGLSGAAVGSVVNQIDLFDPVTGAWFPSVTSFSAGPGTTAVSFSGAVGHKRSTDGHHLIVVIGGFDSLGGQQSLVQIYDVEANAWSLGASMGAPVAPRSNIYAVNVFGKAYVICGTNGAASGAGYTPSTTVYEYAIESNSWSAKLAAGPASGSDRFAAAFNNTVYFIAGRNTAVAASTVADAYSTTANSTTAVVEPPLATARTGVAGAIWTPASGSAKILIVGGATVTAGANNFIGGATGGALTTVQSLDFPFIAPAVWTISSSPPPAPFPVAICFGAAAIYGDTLYHFGGSTAITTPSVVAAAYSYNLASLPPSWSSPVLMPVGRWGHVAVTFPQ